MSVNHGSSGGRERTFRQGHSERHPNLPGFRSARDNGVSLLADTPSSHTPFLSSLLTAYSKSLEGKGFVSDGVNLQVVSQERIAPQKHLKRASEAQKPAGKEKGRKRSDLGEY